MKNRIRFVVLAVLCISAAFTLNGCTKTYFTGLSPQSHFDFPNSNVIPLGRVVGESSRTAIFAIPDEDSDLIEEAVMNALKQKAGANILINYMTFKQRTEILFISTLTLRVEGTACKMEIGTQKLK